MDGDGTNVVRVTARTGFQPAWSPDGSRIVFGSGVGRKAEIFVVNADGTNLARLTDNRVEDLLPAWSPDGGTVAFTSPDGTRLVFQSNRHRNSDDLP